MNFNGAMMRGLASRQTRSATRPSTAPRALTGRLPLRQRRRIGAVNFVKPDAPTQSVQGPPQFWSRKLIG